MIIGSLELTHPNLEHHGLCRALSYIMQSLSAEPRFGQRMQSLMPQRIPIPQKWVALGTAADFFVSVCPHNLKPCTCTLLIKLPVHLLHSGNHIWCPQLTIPRTHHCSRQCGSLSEKPGCQVVEPTRPSLLRFLKPHLPPRG